MTAKTAIQAADALLLSVVSPWELGIKSSLGKIDLHRPLEDLCDAFVREFGASVLQITLRHVMDVTRLPMHHGDPFDRLLIAQARVEGLHIVTRDRWFEEYGVPVIRA
jgi:PIN domain nuclease of toxin-antitoxin system